MDGKVTIGLDLDSKSFDMEIAVTEQKLEKLVDDYETLKSAKPYEGQIEDLQKLQVEIEQTKNKIVDLKTKQEKYNETTKQTASSGFINATNQLNSINNVMDGVIAKVIRWGLAVFSIRSAYSLVRQSVSTLSQYNEKIGADIEYMRFALATALQPVIERIINLAYKLMVYVGYIIKQLFGVNIFANASAKAFERSKNALGGSAKKAKELQKTLTGIDEMNIIQDTGDTSYGGGGGGVALPTKDLAEMLENFKAPEWLDKLIEKLKKLKDWIKENWDWLSKLLEILGIVFGASKVAGWLSSIGNLIGFGAAGGGGSGLLGLLGTVGLLAAAIYLVPQAVDAVAETWDTWKKLKNEVDNQVQRGDSWYKGLKKIEKVSKDTNSSQKDLNTTYNYFNNIIDQSIKATIDQTDELANLTFTDKLLDNELTKRYSSTTILTDAINQNTDDIDDNIISIKNMKVAGTLTTEQEEKFKTTLRNMIPQLEQQRDKLDKGSDAYKRLDSTIDFAKSTLKHFEEGTVTAGIGLKGLYEKAKENVIGKLSNAFNETNTKVKNVITSVTDLAKKQIGDKRMTIHVDANATAAESSLGGFTARLKNSVQNAFDSIRLNKLADGLVNMMSKLAPSVPSSKIRSVFGLASGGIINMPGRGVPLTNNVIGGEAGREGIIPLTDAQAMSTLGEAIGKYITINASITNTMNGRVISRELQKINTENDFAYNR